MEKWIAEAYELFAPYSVRFPLNICTCNSCSPEDFQQALLEYPLREIPVDMLQAYLGSVPLDKGAATALERVHSLRSRTPKKAKATICRLVLNLRSQFF